MTQEKLSPNIVFVICILIGIGAFLIVSTIADIGVATTVTLLITVAVPTAYYWYVEYQT